MKKDSVSTDNSGLPPYRKTQHLYITQSNKIEMHQFKLKRFQAQESLHVYKMTQTDNKCYMWHGYLCSGLRVYT